MNYLVVGLGNIGEEYKYTRHNIGFLILDALAEQESIKFELNTLAFTAFYKHRGRNIYLIKPTTFMNLSGKALMYYKNKFKVPLENILVVTDDLSLEMSILRLKGQGSAGGHNGLKSIEQLLASANYTRLKIGIGSNFRAGQQIDYVLGKWTDNEVKVLPEIIDQSCKVINSFCAFGLQQTMNTFNGKPKAS